jgi:AraC-like DNA-binding protein
MRRLALSRTAIESGLPLAQVAAEAGFADQSHMTRQFKRAYGLTPSTLGKGRCCRQLGGAGAVSFSRPGYHDWKSAAGPNEPFFIL